MILSKAENNRRLKLTDQILKIILGVIQRLIRLYDIYLATKKNLYLEFVNLEEPSNRSL